MDEFSALMLRNLLRSAEQNQLPPGLRGVVKGRQWKSQQQQ